MPEAVLYTKKVFSGRYLTGEMLKSGEFSVIKAVYGTKKESPDFSELSIYW